MSIHRLGFMSHTLNFGFTSSSLLVQRSMTSDSFRFPDEDAEFTTGALSWLATLCGWLDLDLAVPVLLSVFRLGAVVELLSAVRCCLRGGASARADAEALFCTSDLSYHYWWKVKETHPGITWLLFMRCDDCPNIRHDLGWTTRRCLAPENHKPRNFRCS